LTYTIKAQFDSTVSPAKLSRWLTTAEGIAGWWSDKVEGEADKVGDVFRVTFPTSPVVFVLRVSARDDHVVEWRIDEDPPWWKGTTIRFEATEKEGGSTLLFTHGGFEADDPIIPVITPAWVRFLDNLVEVAQTDTPNPAVRN